MKIDRVKAKKVFDDYVEKYKNSRRTKVFKRDA